MIAAGEILTLVLAFLRKHIWLILVIPLALALAVQTVRIEGFRFGHIHVGFVNFWLVKVTGFKNEIAEERAKVLAAEMKIRAAQQKQIDERSTAYEQDRTTGASEAQTRETQIRTIYKTRVVPGVCAAPDDARRVLDDAVSAANARARGEPGRAVPTPAGTPSAAARP